MLIIFFILGLLIGSFLNVLVYRLNVAESFLLERSHCPHCKKKIRWYDNIPVISFVILGFRCRDCKKKISWQYPLVEIATGLVFAGVAYNFLNPADTQSWPVVIYYLGISSALIVIFVYDFLYMEIPSLVLWPAIFWTIAFNLYFDLSANASLISFRNVDLLAGTATYSGILAAFLGFLFFFGIVAISKEKWMGMGDAYVAILMGLVLGWPEMLLALFLAFSIGAIYGIMLIALKKKKMKSQIPFAPFLVIGTIISIFFYVQIIDWYLNFLLN